MITDRKSLSLLAGAALMAACVSSGVATPQPVSPTPAATVTPAATGTPTPHVAGHVTLTEYFDEMAARSRLVCTVDADGQALVAGTLRLTAMNNTQAAVVVSFLRIADGHTYGDLSARLVREDERPTWAQNVTSLVLDAGESSAGEGTLTAGTHAIGCAWPAAR
jgi:hypothetical protein